MSAVLAPDVVVDPDRARVEALVVVVVAALRTGGFAAVADGILAAHEDDARAAILFDTTDRIGVGDADGPRNIYLRFAVQFTGRTLESWAECDLVEAMVWRRRAAVEIERFHDVQEGDLS